MVVLSKGVWVVVLALALAAAFPAVAGVCGAGHNAVVASSEGGSDGSGSDQSPDTDFAFVSVEGSQARG